jgi:uncharacterized protein
MIRGLAKLSVRLLLIGGVAAGGYLAYRRLTGSDGEAPTWEPASGPEPVPAPPQNIHDLLPILACPNCKGPLRLSDDEQQLICDNCQVYYVIDDGIPVLLPDSGRPLAAGS